MHNPVFALARICTKEFKLPPQYPGSKDGPTVALGTPIVIPIYAIQQYVLIIESHYRCFMFFWKKISSRSDSKYYPNPLVFDPNRFSETEANARNKYAFLGFGEGPRICLGKNWKAFAILCTPVVLMSFFFA